jgi:hypothetical protein
MPEESSQREPARLEGVLKVVAALVALAGVVPGIISALGTARINAQTAAQNAKNAEVTAMNARIALANARREAQKPYLERMLPIYQDMIKQTGTIAGAAYNAGGVNDAVTKRYHEIYPGEIRLYANDEVVAKLDAFEQVLGSIDLKAADRATLNKNNNLLGDASKSLGRAMRNHIASMTSGPE